MGRVAGKPNLTTEARVLIAEDVRTGIKTALIARRHNVSPGTVARIAGQLRDGSLTLKPTGMATPTERLALSVTNYRLAIEMARGALCLGRVSDALAHLDQAVTP